MRLVFLLALFFYSVPAYLQKPTFLTNPNTSKKNLYSNSPAGTEICNNNIDDDGNGLVDCKDYSCYFKPGEASCVCKPIKLIWFCDGNGALYWVDLETQIEKKVGTMETLMGDITWTPQGKLYGMNGSGIFEIDPATAAISFLTPVPGYFITNAMTSDEEGNLYLAALTPDYHTIIIKYRPSANVTTVICDLNPYRVGSGGDLVFSRGLLYLACGGGTLAAIDIHTANVTILHLSGLPGPGSDNYGLASLAGGLLYISHGNQIYSFDPISLQASVEYTYPDNHLQIFGMANYNDLCNSPPACTGSVHINIQNGPPFCQNTGAVLRAQGTGFNATSQYTWLKPDGTFIDSQILLATQPGTYKVRYHTMPDTCEAWDTIAINFIASPIADIGADTFICIGTQLELQSKNNNEVVSWLWSNGSTTSHLIISHGGDYWLQVSNTCGSSSDTIHVSEISNPHVDLGVDFSICPGEMRYIKNASQKNAGEKYRWSNGSANDSIRIESGGVYWLESSNSCGVRRDSVFVFVKDSCTCNPIYPALELGPTRELCKLDTLILTNSLDAPSLRYLWNDGSSKKFLRVNSPGRYWATVSTYCGSVTDTVVVLEKQTGCECFVSIPNAFSPNSGTANRKFKINSHCPITGELSVFNRWGQLIFQTTNPYAGWDGNFKGTPQQAGTYVYELIYHFTNRPAAGSFVEKGTFILIR